MVPLELSVKLTVSGLSPLVGLPLKLAAGATAPVPVSALVLPPLLLLTTTTLLKLAALPGAKLTTRLVEPKPGRLKGVPERIVKGPPLMVARPLLKDAPPWLVITKLAWALEPTATVPKLRLAGETPSWAGVRLVPLMLLVELPPLLVKTTTLLKLPAPLGANLTTTFVEPKPARLNGVPERMAKGPPLIVTKPLVRDASPRLVSTKLARALEPTITVPKLRLAGETPSWAGVTPEPVTLLVKLPPLLVKTTTLLKLPALAGLKVTCTWPVWSDVRLKGLPLRMAKGNVVETAPVRVRPPALTTWKLSVLLWPITTGAKAKLVGLSDNTGGELLIGVTVVMTEAELLAKVGSAAAAVTLAVLVIVPSMAGLTVMPTVAVALLSRLPKLQVTMPFD